MNNELNECPWCDPADEPHCKDEYVPSLNNLGKYYHPKNGPISLGYAVVCGYCGARGPISAVPSDAINFWNDRISDVAKIKSERTLNNLKEDFDKALAAMTDLDLYKHFKDHIDVIYYKDGSEYRRNSETKRFHLYSDIIGLSAHGLHAEDLLMYPSYSINKPN